MLVFIRKINISAKSKDFSFCCVTKKTFVELGQIELLQKFSSYLFSNIVCTIDADFILTVLKNMYCTKLMVIDTHENMFSSKVIFA